MIKTPTSPFTVMDASAGSGKTRNLVKAVLLQALGERDVKKAIRPVLALTFTNKAAAEMKHRLLEYLIDFSGENPKESGLLHELSEELELTQPIIKERARLTLKHILHNYNDLSFGTLDSFTSRLVRTFAKDMALSENFEITLDFDNLLHEATDAVMSEAGRDEELTNILVRFVQQKLADESSPNIDSAIFKTAKKLMEERHREPLERLAKYTPEELLTIRKKLQAKIEVKKAILKKEGENISFFLDENDVDPLSFSYGKSGLYSYLNKAKDGNFEGATKINRRSNYIDKDAWYAKGAHAEVKASIDAIKDELKEKLLRLELFAMEQAPFILQAEAICNNMFSFATLNALSRALTQLTEARNTIPLANFNHIVHEQLQNEPSNYIYERLGEKYNHYYLDEFQDTSLLQWGNLKPLVEDSLAGGGSALVVGDAKQSIYRWRNGEAEQFIELSAAADEKTFQFKGDANLERLDSNWRSLDQIVEFNNGLFTHAADALQDEGYKKLYENASQKAKRGTGGFVELKQFHKDTFFEESIEHTVATIKQLVDEGFALRDIALLVRSKKHGADVVQVLTTNGIPVISADSLLLGNSYEGMLLAGLSALRSMPENKQMRWLVANSLLSGGFHIPAEGAFSFAQKIVQLKQEEVVSLLDEHFSGLSNLYQAPTDLYDFTLQLANVLGLKGKNNAFVDSYLQAIHDFVELESGTGFDFVKWWNEDGSLKAINAAENMDAVQIVTIHKCKGLQYPVVLLPFATWKHNIGGRETWLPLNPVEYEGLEEMILPLSQNKAEVIGGDYASEYARLQTQEVFDSLNMLYVACTRAVQRLYVSFKSTSNANEIGTFLQSFADQNTERLIHDGLYQWGKALPKSGDSRNNTRLAKHQDLVTENWQTRLKLAHSAPPGWETNKRDARTWGNRVHYILSRIETVYDIEKVLESLRHKGSLVDAEMEEISKLINQVVGHPELQPCFANGITVYNERDILLPNEDRKRPDRLVKLTNGEVFLIDYKTGEEESKHKKQLSAYADLLKQAGIDVSSCLLVYINEKVEVVKVD